MTERERIEKAAKDFIEASDDLRKDEQVILLLAEILKADTAHLSNLQKLNKQIGDLSRPYVEKRDRAKEILEASIIETKAGVVFGRLEATYQKGKRSPKYKGVAGDLTEFLVKEVGKENAQDMYEEVLERHTSTGDPSVKFEILKETK